jgi:hypothetical protein
LSYGETVDDLIFIHHSIGAYWLEYGLEDALLAKDYIDERNDISFDDTMSPDPGRPNSLWGIPGDYTDMGNWVPWFNDYLGGLKTRGCADGVNRIIMFKPQHATSGITSDGTEPGDPFHHYTEQSIANYKAVYRHPDGPGNTYTRSGYVYQPLEDIFAENPDFLFIAVTAPPYHYTMSTDEEAHRARLFNDWLTNDWLDDYNARNPGLNNVAVFDLFDLLAYPDDDPDHPNRLRIEYSWASPPDSHPIPSTWPYITAPFATDPGNFIDSAYAAFAAPEPSTISMVVLGACMALAIYARRRKTVRTGRS